MGMCWTREVESVHRRDKSRIFHRICLVPLGMGTEKKERPQQVVCYRAGCETKGLGLEDRRDTKDLRLAYRLPTCFLTCELRGNAYYILRQRAKYERQLEKKI